MATFVGDGLDNTADAVAGTILGFAGGNLTQLQDSTGDTFSGNGGNDIIRAGTGGDTIFGGAGNDTLSGGGTPNLTFDTIHGEDGNDIISADGTYANLFGGRGADTITANMSVGEVEGGAGTDTLIGFGGFISGSLSYRASFARVVVNLQTNSATGGDATGDTISGFINLYGSAFNDILTAHATVGSLIRGLDGNDRIFGGNGGDSLQGGNGDDLLRGGLGDDTLVGGLGADTLDGGDGNDTASYDLEAVAVTVDLATQSGGGGAAGDIFISIENVIGSNGNDTLRGSSRDESLDGSFGNDELTGLAGDDRLRGSIGDDTLYGGQGDDDLLPGSGADDIFGGSGRDVVDYLFASGAMTIDLRSGGTGSDAQGDTYHSIEDATGGSGNDTIIGTSADNMLLGNSGTDTLNGGAGDDLLEGGSGADTLNGGIGSDWAIYDFASVAMTIDLAGTGVGDDAAGDTFASVENVRTNQFSSASVTALGTGVNNTLITGAGADTLNGRAGDDWLQGNRGEDVAFGGAGADSFVFAHPGFVPEHDIIRDFSRAEGDTLVFLASGFFEIGPTLTASEFVISGVALDASDRILYDNTNGRLYFDRDGTGASARILLAVLTGAPTVTFADLDLV